MKITEKLNYHVKNKLLYFVLLSSAEVLKYSTILALHGYTYKLNDTIVTRQLRVYFARLPISHIKHQLQIVLNFTILESTYTL